MPSVCLIYLTFGFLCLFYVEKEMIRKKPSRPVFHSAYERVGVKVSFRRRFLWGRLGIVAGWAYFFVNFSFRV